MANFEYYATFDESIAMLREVVGLGFRVVWDPGAFTNPNPPMHRELTNELIGQLREQPYCYLALPSASSPPSVHVIEGGVNQGQYSFDVFSAAEHVRCDLAADRQIENQPTLMLGNIGHQSRYKSVETGEWRPASAELKTGYKTVVSTMKKHLVQHTFGLKVWIGREALKAVQEKRMRIIDVGTLHGTVK